MAENNPGIGDGDKPPRNYGAWIEANTVWARKWIKANPVWFCVHLLNVLDAIILYCSVEQRNFAILAVFIFMCIIFVQIYTDPIKSLLIEGSNPDDRRKIEETRSQQRNKWMIFAYSFMLLSLLLTFYPFMNPLFDTKPADDKSSPNQVKKDEESTDGKSGSNQSTAAEQPSQSKENGYLRTLRERPIAVFIGCTLDSTAKNLRCEEPTEPKKEKVPNPADGKQSQSPVIPPSGGDQGSQPQAKEKASNPAGGKQDQPPAVSSSSGGQGNQPQTTSSESIGQAWVINIGGYVKRCYSDNSNNSDSGYGNPPTCEVREGLLIPLYFIILALMGGSISLTRRLPELQKQVGAEHVATATQPQLTQHEFREHLIFQMVQFISAPFLAILAYYLIEPSNTTQAVVLAFTAGFASETILLMIRSIANKITPETSTTPKYGAVAGVVTLGNKDPELGKPAGEIKVSLSGLPQKQSITDESGFYMLDNIPVGDHGIIFKYQGDKGNGEVKDMVKIDHAQAIVKKNVTIVLQKPGEENK